jgi:hypothetical protein
MTSGAGARNDSRVHLLHPPVWLIIPKRAGMTGSAAQYKSEFLRALLFCLAVNFAAEPRTKFQARSLA